MRSLRIFWPLIFIILFLCSNNRLFAAIGFEDAVFPELATSGRALAMGSAYINRVDDSASVFYNPAGLGSVRFPHIHLSNIHFEVNDGWMEIAAGGRITDAVTDFWKGFNLDGIRQLLVDDPGHISHSAFHVLPNITYRHFSAGILYAQKTRAFLGEESDALFEYATRRDYGPFASLNLSLFGGIIKFGASAILLERREKIAQVDPDEVISLGDGDYQKGSALIVTGGFRLTLPYRFLPTFSLVAHNATGQTFSGRAAGAPTTIEQTYDVGFSLTPQIGKTTRVHFEVNVKDATNEYSGVSRARKYLFGMEFDFSRVMFMRLGYGDGFGTFGLGIKTKKLEFDLTTYAVDATASEFQGKIDRRYALTISAGF